MQITGPKGNDLATMAGWGARVKGGHFKEGRSAYSLADFILNRNGAAILESRLSSVLSQPVKLQRAIPEFWASFDSYGGRQSIPDLGIFGTVGSKSSLFVGLEAKVDEPFDGKTVGEKYQDAIRKKSRKPRSRAYARVENLLSSYFAESAAPGVSRFSDVGYQLLTGTAGTIARQKDVSIFYVLVFKTSEYDERKGRVNQEVYEKFIEAANGKPLTQSREGPGVHEITVAGKRLICIYDYFHLP